MARLEAWEERHGAGPVEEGAMGTAKKRTHKYVVISFIFSYSTFTFSI